MFYKNEEDMCITDPYLCNCTRSETRMDKPSQPCLKEMAATIAERHCDLTGRHRYLREKITAMERSIPALMAYNMWIAGKNCEGAPYCKIRDIMNKLSPDLDPTEKLLRNLKSDVKELNKETTQLHDKIIDVDIKLEETEMELESTELANIEMDEQANELENELRSYRGSSLHSIHSEDVICLTKIHELAKEELDLKDCIALLEKKEAMYAEQLDRLLASKEFQSIADNKGMLKRIQDLESNERKMHCALQFYKNNIQQLKNELVHKSSDGCNITAPVKGAREKPLKTENIEDKTPALSKEPKSQRADSKEHKTARKKQERPAFKEKSDESCICSNKSNHEPAIKRSGKSPKKAQVSPVDKNLLKSVNVPTKKFTKSGMSKCKMVCASLSMQPKPSHGFTEVKNPCSVDLPCDVPSGTIMSKCSTAPCNLNDGPGPCKRCSLPRHPNECVCSCKGKCASGLSSVPCRCGVSSSCPLDKGYQPPPNPLSCCYESTSESDEEYCECCSCGCQDYSESGSSCICE